MAFFKFPKIKLDIKLLTLTLFLIFSSTALHTYQTSLGNSFHVSNQSQKGQVLQASSDCGYINLSPNGKGLVCSNTADLFVPLGWKPTIAWKWFPPGSYGGISNWMIDGQSYEEWVRDELVANGVNFINIWLNSYGSGIPFQLNAVWKEDLGEYIGEYNSAMDDGTEHILWIENLPSNASSQHRQERHALLYGLPDDISDGSNITQLIEACEEYGVKIKISFIRQANIRNDWDISIYNEDRITYPCDDNSQCWWCRNSVSGNCVPGPASSRQEALTEQESLDIMKERIRFIYENWGDSPAIGVWELMVEINQVTKDAGVDGIKDWVREIGGYIRQLDTHNRPIMLGSTTLQWQPWGSSTDPSLPEPDPDASYDKYGVNTIYDMEEVDIVSHHNYFHYNLWNRLIVHRLLQERYPDKVIIYGGGSGPNRASCPGDGYCMGLPPEVNGPFIPDYAHQYHENEYEGIAELRDPWINSKAHVWLNLIASGGTGGATRFTSNRPYYTNGFSSIYYAPSKFVEEVNWDHWDINSMRPWEDWEDWGIWSNPHAISMEPWVDKRPSVENADFIVGQGDGDQLMMMVRGSQNSVVLTIPDLEPGTYSAKIFDWLTGDVIEERIIEVNSQPIDFSMNLSDSNLTSNGECNNAPNDYGCYDDPSNPYYSRRRMAIVYMEKDITGIPTPTPTPTPSPSIPGDLDGDRDVDIFDLIIVGSRFGEDVGVPCIYDPCPDADGDGDVDIFDLITVGSHFGEGG
jgi:hypothetical protein